MLTLPSPYNPQAESCVYEYNQITRNGTRAVPDLYKNNGNASLFMRIIFCLCPPMRKSITRVSPNAPDESSSSTTATDAAAAAPSTPMPGSMPEKMEEITAVEEGEDGAADAADGSPKPKAAVEIAEALSSRGTLFSAGSHQFNQAYNVQADLHTLIDSHFTAVSARARTILNEQREKLCRSLNTDLKAALRENALSSHAVDAFRDRLAKKKNSPTKKSGSASGSRSKGVRIRNVFERGMTSKVVTENSTGGGGGGGDGDAGGVRRALEMDVVEEIAPGTVVDEGQQPAQEEAAGVEVTDLSPAASAPDTARAAVERVEDVHSPVPGDAPAE